MAANSSHPAIRAAFDSSVPRMISMYFGIAFSSSVGAASRPRTRTHTSNERPADRHGPEESLAATQPNPSDPRCARQTWPAAMADADAMLIRKLIVAALEGGDARTDLRKPFGTHDPAVGWWATHGLRPDPFAEVG
ncbi:hypothetical protein GCM10010399_34340 [Dactylosporangium fulvum]